MLSLPSHRKKDFKNPLFNYEHLENSVVDFYIEAICINLLLYWLFIACTLSNSFFLSLFFLLQNSYDEIMPMARQISASVKNTSRIGDSPQAFYSKFITGRSASPVHIFSLCLFLLQRTFGQRRLNVRSIQSVKVLCNKIVRYDVRTNNATADFVSGKGCRTI